MVYVTTKIKEIMKWVTVILVLVLLLQSLGIVPKAHAAEVEGYKDINNSHWSYDSVLWGQAQGIVTGYPDGTFRPNASVTESQFLAMLIRSYGDTPNIEIPSSGVYVIQDSHWAAKYYQLAAKLNYPTIENKDAFITRTQVAELVVGTQGKFYEGQQAIQYMLGNGLAKGRTSTTIEGYEGNGKLTRAEAVQFIRNVIEKVGSKSLLERPLSPSDPKDLPKVPALPAKPVPQTKAEQLRKAVENELGKDGYVLLTSSANGEVIVDDAKGETIAVYGNYIDQVGTQVTTFYVKSEANVQILMRIWKAAGVTVDDRLSKALIEAINGKSEKVSISYKGFTAYILAKGSVIQFTEVK